ncbi:MAG: hypothetical protein WCD63_21040 [Terrimicrobiaceae bacterium]
MLPNNRDQHVAGTHTFFDRIHEVDARVQVIDIHENMVRSKMAV